MEKLQKSQLSKILLLVFFLVLLSLTPFVSSSMRSSYLYFLLNLLIIVLGIEAGFLSFISKPRDEKNPVSFIANTYIEAITNSSATIENPIMMKVERVDKKAKVESLKRCKSRPSLFFIGECDDEEEAVPAKKVVGDDQVGELSKQELFMKAEMFIRNFYKQLKNAEGEVMEETKWAVS